MQPSDIQRLSPKLRKAFNARHKIVHPENPALDRLTHVLWTGKPRTPGATARNAVFYGDKAIDRSPCGTGTSARMAQLHATGRLKQGEDFVHESIIGTMFKGHVEFDHQRRQSAGDHSFIRRLGAGDGPQHDLRRRSRPALGGLSGGRRGPVKGRVTETQSAFLTNLPPTMMAGRRAPSLRNTDISL